MSTGIISVQPSQRSALRGMIARHPLSTYFGIALSSVWGLLLQVVLARDGLGLLPFTVSDIAKPNTGAVQ